MEETSQNNTISRLSEGLVFGCVGPRGAGKNIIGTFYALDYRNNPDYGPDRTFTNWPIEGVKPLDLKLFLDMKVAEKDQKNGTHEYPYWDCFIGWDEPHRTVDMRRSSSKTNLDGCEVFDQSRKLGIRLFWCDKPHRVDLRVRENCDTMIEAKNDHKHECFTYTYTDPDKPNKMRRIITYKEASEWWNKYYTRWLIPSSYTDKTRDKGGGQRIRSEDPQMISKPSDNHLPSPTNSTPLPHGVQGQKMPDGVSSRKVGHALQTNYAKSLAMGEFKAPIYKIINNIESGPDIIILLNDKPFKVISYKSMWFEELDTTLTHVGEDGRQRRWGKRNLWVGIEDVSPELEYCRASGLSFFDLVVHNIRTGGYVVLRQDVETFRGVSVSLKAYVRLQ